MMAPARRSVAAGILVSLCFGTPALAQRVFAPYSHTTPTVAEPTAVCIDCTGDSPRVDYAAIERQRAEQARVLREKLRLATAAFSKGRAAFSRGNYDQAVTLYREARKHDPTNPVYDRRIVAALQERFKQMRTRMPALDEARAILPDQTRAAADARGTRSHHTLKQPAAFGRLGPDAVFAHRNLIELLKH